MSPNDPFRVIGSKPVIAFLKLSTKIQFSTDVAHMSTHPVYLYWSMSSNKEMEAYRGSWHLCSDNDTCDRSNTPEFEIKGNTAISSVWLTSCKCCIGTWYDVTVEDFNYTLQQNNDLINKKSKIILLGDFNAKVGLMYSELMPKVVIQ